MIRSSRILPWLTVLTALCILNACSPGPDPDAKRVLVACLTVSDVDASAILGAQVEPFRLTGDDAPRAICAFNDAKSNTFAMVQLQKADNVKDVAAALAADQQSIQTLLKDSIIPVVFHPAVGFGTGAFYVDNSVSPGVTSVQLHLIQNDYSIMVQVNNPKSFPDGEKQAASLAHKMLDNMQNGTAYEQ